MPSLVPHISIDIPLTSTDLLYVGGRGGGYQKIFEVQEESIRMLLLLEHRSLSGANKGTLSGKPKSTTTNAFQYIEKIALDSPPPK